MITDSLAHDSVPPNRRDAYRGIPVVVFGASGFIGRWVARALSAQEAHLSLIVRNRAVAEAIFLTYSVTGDLYEVDLLEPGAVEKWLQKLRPSIVFNLAGYGIDPSERSETIAYQINEQLVRAICEVVADRRDRDWQGRDIVHAGSGFEYGAIGGNLDEDSIPNPTTLYGKSKLAGTQSLELYCRRYGIKGLTARLFTVYGPGEHEGRLLPSLLNTARTGTLLRLTSGVQKRDFTYVEDVAEGLLRLGLVTERPAGIVNLATGRLICVRHFVETAARILRIPYDRLEFGSLPNPMDEMDHSGVTLERLRRLIGWCPPTGIEEGIRKTSNFQTVHGTR